MGIKWPWALDCRGVSNCQGLPGSFCLECVVMFEWTYNFFRSCGSKCGSPRSHQVRAESINNSNSKSSAVANNIHVEWKGQQVFKPAEWDFGLVKMKESGDLGTWCCRAHHCSFQALEEWVQIWVEGSLCVATHVSERTAFIFHDRMGPASCKTGCSALPCPTLNFRRVHISRSKRGDVGYLDSEGLRPGSRQVRRLLSPF